MKPFLFSSLRVQLALLILMALPPMLGLTFYTYREERELIVSHVQDDVNRMAQFAAGAQEQLIDNTRQLLLTIARLPEIQEPESTGERACSAHFNRLLDEYPRYANFGVIQLDGTLVCSGTPEKKATSFAEEHWFRRTLATRDFAMGSCPSGPAVDKATLNISYPIVDSEGQPKAVVFASVDLSRLDYLTSQVVLPGHAEFLMISRSRIVLARLPDPEKWVGTAMPDVPLIEAIVSRGEGLVQTEGMDGVTRFYAFTPLCSSVDTGLFVSIGVPAALVHTVANRILLHHFLGLALVTMMALSAVWFGSDVFILRRVNILVSTARRLSGGDMAARTGLKRGTGELDHLAKTFDEMADALEHRALELRQSEGRFRLLVECVKDYAIFMLNPDGTVASWNTGAERVAGYRADEIIARSYALFFTPEDLELGAAEQELRSARAAGWLEDEGWRVRKDGSRFWANVILTALRDPDGRFIGFSCIIRDLTEHKRAEEKLLNYQSQLRSLASQLSLAEERERRRIATELHDRVGQTLAMSKIRLGLLKQSASSPEFAEAADEVRKLIEQAIQDTRSLVFEISSPILYELGFEAALEWLVEQVQKRHSIRAIFEDDGQSKPLDEDIRVLLFQATSELLVNVVKHSHAKSVKVTVRREAEWIRVCVEDNGVGFETSEEGIVRSIRSDGFGLFSIRERFDHVDGHLEVSSEPGRGTRMTLVAPLRSK